MFSAIYIAPAHLAWIILDDSFLHCLVFKEHRRPLCYLSANQLLYLTSFSSFCQELFSEGSFKSFLPLWGYPPWASAIQGFSPERVSRCSLTTCIILHAFLLPVKSFSLYFYQNPQKIFLPLSTSSRKNPSVFFLIQQFNELFFWNWSWKIIALD